MKENKFIKSAKTLKRLMSAGYSEDESKKLIGCVVLSELFDVLEKQEPFNPARFSKALTALPTLPED